MAIVYKYYPPTEYSFDALEKGYFYFSKVARLNDPFDSSYSLISKFSLTQSWIERGMIHPESESIMREYGTCSFSEKRDSKHMWTFYADNYKGMLIGYDESTYKRLAPLRIGYYKMQYVDSVINIDDPSQEFILDLVFDEPRKYSVSELDETRCRDEFFAYLCTVKEKETWQNEAERRLILGNDVLNNQERLEKHGIEYGTSGYRVPMPSDCIKEIYVGHNMFSQDQLRIRQIADKYGIEKILRTELTEPFGVGFVAL